MAIRPACLLPLKAFPAGTSSTSLERVALPRAVSAVLLLTGVATVAFALTRVIETVAAGLRLNVLVFMRISGWSVATTAAGDTSNALRAQHIKSFVLKPKRHKTLAASPSDCY